MSKAEKLYTVAGTSTLNGANTFRFATGKVSVRAAKLKRHGHVDVDLIDLPQAMTKAAAVDYLVSIGRTAVIPTTRTSKPVELSDAQKTAAAAAAADAAARAAEVQAMDEQYLANVISGEDDEAPVENTDETTDAMAAANVAADELLAAVDGQQEFGVDAERTLASQS